MPPQACTLRGMQLFRPKMPAIPEPAKAPTVDDAAQAEADIMRLRKRRGLASTFLVGREQRTRSPAADALMGTGTGTALGATPSASAGARTVPR
jgi:hypothetical protein